MIMYIFKLIKNKKRSVSLRREGFSLIELIISTAIFSSLMLAVTVIFSNAIAGYRSGIAAQNTQESMRFAFEMMSKELRLAQIGPSAGGDCPAPGQLNRTFNVIADALNFRDDNGQCVIYKINNDRVEITRGGDVLYITPDEVIVTDLRFDVVDDTNVTVHTLQPRVTIKMEAEMDTGKTTERQKIVMQTTISSRGYD